MIPNIQREAWGLTLPPLLLILEWNNLGDFIHLLTFSQDHLRRIRSQVTELMVCPRTEPFVDATIQRFWKTNLSSGCAEAVLAFESTFVLNVPLLCTVTQQEGKSTHHNSQLFHKSQPRSGPEEEEKFHIFKVEGHSRQRELRMQKQIFNVKSKSD